MVVYDQMELCLFSQKKEKKSSQYLLKIKTQETLRL